MDDSEVSESNELNKYRKIGKELGGVGWLG